MKPESPNFEHFIRWFVIPFHTLKNVPSGDAAFVAFSIGFSLCERYHRIESKTQDDWKQTDEFKNFAAKHLDVNPNFFSDFWDVFRNGVQHQASPKWRKGDKKAGRKPYKWAIDAAFPHKPILAKNEKNEDVICINPWAFTEHYISIFLANPELLNDAVHHSFGHIFERNKLQDFQELSHSGHAKKWQMIK
jgi:hypothetical protein